MSALELAQHAREALAEKKARDVVLLDLRKISTFTDYTMVATGTSGPQLKAMSVSIQQALKKLDVLAYRTAGAPESGWLVLDYVDVIIHLFSPQAREYYAIEELWDKAKRVE